MANNGVTASNDTEDDDDLKFLKDRGFTVGRLLGMGSYSRVILIHLGPEARAVKVISKVKCPRDYLEEFLPKELDIFPSIQHENIIRCHETLEAPTTHFIVMEYADCGNLLERLQEEGQMEEEEARRFFRETARAVQYCHFAGIAHRDLKLDNILLSRCGGITKVKLSDFGFSVRTRNAEGEKTLCDKFCGSPPYTAPEVLQKGGPYDAMCADIWSLGVILYGMLYFRMPYNDSDVTAMIQKQLQRCINFPAFPPISSDCRKLVVAMMEPVVEKRLSADAILQSPWLQSDDI